jgi:glycosyltransferase involved in cell wall biosynthesis
LDAVYAQTFRDFDVLVLDDGSTDGSAELAAEYPCRVERVENGGLGRARRLLVEMAESELIAFVDHDDFWLPQKLELQIAALDRHGADLVHADGWYVYGDGREVARDLGLASQARAFDHILPSNRIIASTALFNRAAMLRAGNFVDDVVRCSDWYGWLILAPGNRFVHLPERLVRYSVLESSLANSGYAFFAAQHYLLTQRILPIRHRLFEGLNRHEAARYTNMLVERSGIALSSMAIALKAQGKRREARELGLKALKAAPAVPRVWSRALRTLV